MNTSWYVQRKFSTLGSCTIEINYLLNCKTISTKIKFNIQFFLHYKIYLSCTIHSFVVGCLYLCFIVYFHRAICCCIWLQFVLAGSIVHDRLGVWRLESETSAAVEALGDSFWMRINFLYSRKARSFLISKTLLLRDKQRRFFIVCFNYSVRLFLQVLKFFIKTLQEWWWWWW
jgi:hypothetical protein